MQKGRTKNYGSPFIRNANLIGAGNKFTPLRDDQGVIQWKLSVIKQAGEKPKIPAIKRKAEELTKGRDLSANRPIKIPARATPKR